VPPVLRVVLLFVVGVLLVLLIFRPAIFLGVNDDALASSIGTSEGCQSDGDDEWTCRAATTDQSNFKTVRVSVDVDPWGCWDAEIVSERSVGEVEVERQSDACVSMANVLFP
jgi:hypothetical protein